jgi:hypothetical protein
MQVKLNSLASITAPLSITISPNDIIVLELDDGPYGPCTKEKGISCPWAKISIYHSKEEYETHEEMRSGHRNRTHIVTVGEGGTCNLFIQEIE